MSSFPRGGYSYRPFKRARKFRRAVKFALGRSSRNPVKAAAYRMRGRGYHPYGQIARPYSSVPRDTKSLDSALLTTNVGNVGAFLHPNIALEGSAFYNRIGRQIQMKSLEVVWRWFTTSAAIATSELYGRLAVVYDRQPNGADPTIDQIWSNYRTNGTNYNNAAVFTNPTFKDRFVVLRDLRIILPAVGAGGTPASLGGFTFTRETNVHGGHSEHLQGLSGHIFIPLKDLMTTFKTSTNSIADISTGALYLIQWTSDTFNSPVATWTCETMTRLRYMDC